ncbi:MAG: hypothetical protein ABIP97_09165 [Chthoniobacterales bacterium]
MKPFLLLLLLISSAISAMADNPNSSPEDAKTPIPLKTQTAPFIEVETSPFATQKIAESPGRTIVVYRYSVPPHTNLNVDVGWQISSSVDSTVTEVSHKAFGKIVTNSSDAPLTGKFTLYKYPSPEDPKCTVFEIHSRGEPNGSIHPSIDPEKLLSSTDSGLPNITIHSDADATLYKHTYVSKIGNKDQTGTLLITAKINPLTADAAVKRPAPFVGP